MDGVVEILALANDDAASLASPAADSPMAAPQPQLDLDDAPMAASATRASITQAYDEAMAARLNAPLNIPQLAPLPRPAPATPARAVAPARPAAPRVAAPVPPAMDMDRISAMVTEAVNAAKVNAAAEMSTMMSELRAMRGMMETQLAELSWGSTQQREPNKTAVLREMLAAGDRKSVV